MDEESEAQRAELGSQVLPKLEPESPLPVYAPSSTGAAAEQVGQHRGGTEPSGLVPVGSLPLVTTPKPKLSGHVCSFHLDTLHLQPIIQDVCTCPSGPSQARHLPAPLHTCTTSQAPLFPLFLPPHRPPSSRLFSFALSSFFPSPFSPSLYPL